MLRQPEMYGILRENLEAPGVDGGIWNGKEVVDEL